MVLTDKHTEFENHCRQTFVGQIIRGVIYGEISGVTDDDRNLIIHEPFYPTKFPDIDSLDYSIYFKTDRQTIYVTWDHTFYSYGLISQQVDFTEATNDYEQKWDVSDDPKWSLVMGRTILDFRIIWEEIFGWYQNGSPLRLVIYPQTFEIKTDNDMTILISAAEFDRYNKDEDIIHGLSDNLLLTTNIELARTLKLIE